MMSSHALPLGTISYQVNGASFTFPGDSVTRTSSRQVPTGDGRAIKWVEHTMTVEGWLFASDLATSTGTVDGAFDATKNILSQAGGALTIVGKGFGDIRINDNISQNRDLSFGPFPKIIDWTPFGNITCHFKWEVSFTLPWKKDIYILPGITDYWWTTSYKYDAAGFCDRTISGEMEIVGSRIRQNSVVGKYSNIESLYRDLIRVDCPLGFHRTGHDITTNPAKTKVMFSFVDEQDRGLTYPPGICDMDVTHEMSASADKLTISKWVWAFSAYAVPEANYATYYGYQACLAAFQSRFKYMIDRVITRWGAIMPFPVSIKVGENVKSRRSSLTCSWVIMATGDAKNGSFMPIDILTRSGMWQPFAWTPQDHKKTADAPLGPNTTGGFTQLATDARQNVIIDIASLAPYIPDPGLATGNIKLQKGPTEYDLFVQPFGKYLEFKVWISVKTAGDMWVNYPLAKDTGTEPANTSKENIQQVTNPYNKYLLKGYILRCGIPSAGIPKLKSMGVQGVAVEIDSSTSIYTNTYQVANVMGMVIWRTDFAVPYTPVKKDGSNPVKAADNMLDDKPKGAVKANDDALFPGIVGFITGGALGTTQTGKG